MPTNDFIGFATGGAANVVTQAAYAAASEITDGMAASSMASSKMCNKVWRQGANMAAALGEVIKAQGNDALDNGDIAMLQGAIEASVQGRKRSSFSLTGDVSDPNLTITVGTERNYVCGNVVQLATAFTFSGTVTTGWTVLATADLTSISDIKSGEAYFIVTEHIAATAAAAHRDRIIRVSVSSGILTVRAYLYAGDQNIDLRPAVTLVGSL